MATITEDYVSFETAKLLKEKGFDVKCDKCYAYFADDDIRILHLTYEKPAQLLSEDRYPCITIQIVMKWLREVQNIAIVVTPSMFWGKYNTHIYEKGNEYPIGFDGSSLCPSYEQAVEGAIKHCLENLI